MQTIWKGAVSFGLVNVPVKMFSATKDNDIPMKMLHKKYNVPIHYTRTCPACKGDVNWSDIVKGFEYEPGRFVTFDKEELEQLASEASREIRILDFVDLEEIDPIYFQKTYYLAPEETGAHAYSLLVQALESKRKIGIANVTIRSKSSLAAIRVVDGVLSMVTMFYAEEVRPVEQIPGIPGESRVDDRELEMAGMLIDQLSGPFDPQKYEDEYRERLLDAIDRKVEGKDVAFAPEEKQTNIIDLMDALKASLQQVQPPMSDPGTDGRKTPKKTGKAARPAGRSKTANEGKGGGRTGARSGAKSNSSRTRRSGS